MPRIVYPVHVHVKHDGHAMPWIFYRPRADDGAMPAVRKPRPKRRTFLKQWREYRQLTQESAAERIGIDRTTLSRIERGLVPYDQAFLEAAAMAYACEPADLLVRDPSREDFIWSIMDTLKAVPIESQPQLRQIVETFKRKTG